MPDYSIVICTYNRTRFLTQNLEAFRTLDFDPASYEILVVDNNSTDDTPAVVRHYQALLPNLRYVHEIQQGLSHARNRGYREALSSCIIYIDDDAIAFPDFLSRIAWVNTNFDFVAWGGIDIPWYPDGRPHWLKDRYVCARLPYKKIHPLTQDTDYFSGFAMVFKKEILEQLGGFHPDLGMKGTMAGYGEETEVQLRIKKQGLKMGYDPELKVRHAILPHKLSLEWFFKATFAVGRDMILLYNIKTGWFHLLGQLCIAGGLILFSMLRWTPRLLWDKNYFIENWILDVFRKFAKRLAIIYFGVLSKKSKGTWQQDSSLGDGNPMFVSPQQVGH